MEAYKKLRSKQDTELLLDLCNAVSESKDIVAASKLLSDLLTPHELRCIANRLRIASMLIEGDAHRFIQKQLSVGIATIVRVNAWLQKSGEGFKAAHHANKSFDKSNVHETPYHLMSDFEKMAKKYKIHHLANHMLTELEHMQSGRHKSNLKKAIRELMKSHDSNVSLSQVKDFIFENE